MSNLNFVGVMFKDLVLVHAGNQVQYGNDYYYAVISSIPTNRNDMIDGTREKQSILMRISLSDFRPAIAEEIKYLNTIYQVQEIISENPDSDSMLINVVQVDSIEKSKQGYRK